MIYFPFTLGKPVDIEKEQHVDWVPTLFMGNCTELAEPVIKNVNSDDFVEKVDRSKNVVKLILDLESNVNYLPSFI